MSRLVEYFVVVSFGSSLEAIDPAELHGSLMDADQAAGTAMAKTMADSGQTRDADDVASTRNASALALTSAESVAAAVAQVGGAGGPKEVEVSTTRVSSNTNNLSPSYVGTSLSPIAGSPMVGSSPAIRHAADSESASRSHQSPLGDTQGQSPDGAAELQAASTTSPSMPLSPASSVGLSASGSPPPIVDSDLASNSGSPSAPAPTQEASPETGTAPASELAPSPAILASSPTRSSVSPLSPTAAAAAAVPLPEESPLSPINGVAMVSVREDAHSPSLSILLSPHGAQSLSSPRSLLSPHPAASPTQPYSTMHAHTNSNINHLAVSVLSPAPPVDLLSPNGTTLQPPGALPQLNISTKTPMMQSPEAVTMMNSMRGGGGGVASTPRSLLSFTERIYRGKIVDRFPLADHRSVPFPPGISMFCIPDDITLTTVPDLPVVYFFAATGANGVRLYGNCLKFAEPLPPALSDQVWAEEKLVQENKRRFEAATGGPVPLRTPGSVMHGAGMGGASGGAGGGGPRQSPSLSRRFAAPFSSSTSTTMSARGGRSTSTRGSVPARSPYSSPGVDGLASTASSSEIYAWCLLPSAQRPTIYASKCLCLLSTHPFLKPFREFLTGLYRLSLTPSTLPIERIICNFMCGEVPLPPLGEIKVQYALNDSIITFARPPANNPFGFHHFPIRLAFECLDFAHVLLVFECLLAERRILLLSSKMSSLTIVAETLLALLYPFTWPHVYIPLLPKALIDFLHAPMPFLIGMHSSYIDVASLQGDILEDLVIVDLDRNIVEMAGTNTKRPPPLPQKEKKKLWRKLKPLNLFSQSKNEYEQKLLDTMDLAFSNAPLPDETDTAEHARANIQQLVSVEINKNQNHSPRSAVRTIDGHQHLFSSGLHTTSHRGQAGPNGTATGGAQPMTSPSALASAKSSSQQGGAFFSSPNHAAASSTTSSSSSSRAAQSTSLFDSEVASIDYLICSAFFRVFISLFKDYRAYLIFPTATNPFPDPCFDVPGFLKGMDGGSRTSATSASGQGVEEWIREFTKTQSFRKFVEDRTFPVTSKDQQKRLTFFEESILAKRNRSKFTRKYDTPFLKDRSTDLARTFVAPSPDTTGLPPGVTYVYPVFPVLDPKLCVKPRITRATTNSSARHRTGRTPSMLIQQSGISLGSWQPKKNANSATSASASSTGSGIVSAMSRMKGGASSSVQTTSGEQVIATLWFVLFAAITGENRQTAALDTAFQVLVNMRANGLQPDEEIFPCLMFACGACAIPERAIDVLREMTNSGYQPDANTYAALLQVFTMNGDHRGAEALANLKGGLTAGTSPITAGALVSSIKRELSKPPLRSAVSGSAASSISSASSTSPNSSSPAPQTFYQHPFDPRTPGSPCSSPMPLKIQQITEPERINMFRLQFEMIFAGLEIRTDEECEECGKKIEDHHIRAGWTQLANDYTTACPYCHARFVARFSVVSKAWAADQEKRRQQKAEEDITVKRPLTLDPPRSPTDAAPLSASHLISDQLSPDSLALFKATRTLAAAALEEAEEKARVDESDRSPSEKPNAPEPATVACPPTPPILVEYLPPRVLKKEVIHLLEVRPARYFTSRSFRTSSPALFWNLVWHFTNQCFPVDFLLRKEKREEPPAHTPNSRQEASSPTKQRRRKKGRSGPSLAGVAEEDSTPAAASSAPLPSGLDSPVSSPSSRTPPDDFERVIAGARVSGHGKAFGYGSGGMVSGPGAVGISLGQMMRTRSALPELQRAVEADLEQTSDEDWGSDQEEEIDLPDAPTADAPLAAAITPPSAKSTSANGSSSLNNNSGALGDGIGHGAGTPLTTAAAPPKSPVKVVFHVREEETNRRNSGSQSISQ